MDTTQRIKELGSAYEPEIIELRRHFHRHPEVGTHEVATSAYIRGILAQMGVDYRLVDGKRPDDVDHELESFIGTGIIATIKGTAQGAYDEDGIPAKRIALRADMDALHVKEQTGSDYASLNEGEMHACGHDCHMAMMLGAVHILNNMRDQIKGEVRIIFQPAEEISLGARDMIAAGALDGVDAIYGAHIWTDLDAGTISCEAGPRMASTDWFRIDIEGVSAHGAQPHEGVDAIVVAAEMVTTLQVLVSRDISPFEPVVVTVGEIHGGTARNVMAGSAYLTGTVRAWDKKTRDELPERMERIVRKVAGAFQAKEKLTYEAGNPNLINDGHLSEVARAAVEKIGGPEAVATYQGTLAGEDFSEYLNYVPGVFAFIGARNPEIGAVHPQHSCYYTIDESVLAQGAMVAAQWACDMLS